MSLASSELGRRGVAALDIVSTLYPPPLRAEVGGSTAGAVAVWQAVPSARDPRVLIGTSGRASGAVVRRQLTGRRMRTRMARNAVALAAASGVLGRVRGMRVVVTGDPAGPSIEDPLRDLLGVDELRLTLPIGPARANRKPILQVTDVHGRALAFCKVGHKPLTTQLVRGEGDALRALEASPRPFVFPRLHGLLDWHGHPLLVLHPLQIPVRRATRSLARARLIDLVGAVARVGGLVTTPWSEHPHRARLEEVLSRCGDVGAELVSFLDGVPASTRLLTGSWHGDLNEGNVAVGRTDTFVWDWERFEDAVPLGYDLLHHDLHRSISAQGVEPTAAAGRMLRDARTILAPLGVAPGTEDVIARTYLVTLAARYAVDQQDAAGSKLGRVREWVIPALREVERGERGDGSVVT